MGRSPCCDKTRVKRGPWSPEEDKTLKNYLSKHGSCGNWIALPRKAGLNRCGKSCRLRWLNYLRPDIKHGGFTKEEDNIIFTLYNTIGSRWSIIASKLPGLRTDNDVKNYWNTKLKKKLMSQKTTRYSNYHNNETITKCDNIEISNCTSSTFLTASSAALPYLMDPNFLLKIDYEQQLNSDPIDQFPYLRNIVDVSKFVVSSSPSDQEEESPSVSTNSSATLALENTCYNNEDEVLKHLAFDSCNDVFLNDFGFQTNS